MKAKAGETTKAPLSGPLLDAIASIQKDYGTGSIMRMGDRVETPVDGISTGSLGLDLSIGGKGLPRGRVIEVFGPESSGKTTLTLHVIANAQKQGGVCAFIDAEHALDPQYAKRLGVDLDSLLISQPDNGEQALDICETLAKSGAIDVIVIDSVAALVPRAEIEGEMGDSFVGLQARLMSQALRKLTAITSKGKTTLIFINQIREKIGVMFGSPETTTGGRALKFYSSVRIDIRRIGQIKDGELPIGARTKATVVKNKVAPPFKKCEFDILFAEGINRLGELLDHGVESGFLKRSGTWISYGETRLGQGREKAREFLRENPELAKEIEVGLMPALMRRNGLLAAEVSAAAAGEEPVDARQVDGRQGDAKAGDAAAAGRPAGRGGAASRQQASNA
ncbi:MAG: recombinase RecA [Planctomycetes bacterium]|nr:recombinase RecA [Planctomycetota bacterium]